MIPILALLAVVPVCMSLVLVGWLLQDARAQRAAPTRTLPEGQTPPPSQAEGSAERWFAASPWPALAQAQGWTVSKEHNTTGRAGVSIHIHGTLKGTDFHATQWATYGLVNLSTSRFVVRAASRQPPEGLSFRGSSLRWERNTAQLSPFQTWVEDDGGPQALTWNSGMLALEQVNPEAELQTLHQALALFAALRQAEFPIWYTPRAGWTLSRDSTGQWPRLRSEVQGQRVFANLEWANGALRTRIMALVPEGRPPFTLVHPAHASGPKVSTRHPIADSLLHASGDGEALHAALQTPGAFEAIMAVVHAYPGSRLTHERIELVAPGDLGALLPQALSQVGQVAACFSGPGA